MSAVPIPDDVLTDASAIANDDARPLPDGAAAAPRLIAVSSTHADARTIPTLDGWRAIAIFGVIAWHLSATVYSYAPGGALAFFVGMGRLGVDLFFAISGFLITSRLAAELDANGTLRLRAFYARRAFRILPPALLYLSLIGVMALTRMWRPTSSEWLASLFFYRNYADGHRITGHLWSLSVEEHFYATWPLVLFFCARGRRALVAVVVMAIGIAVWRVLVVHGVVSFSIPGNLWFRTDIRFDALLWGAALALARRTEIGRARVARWTSWPVWLLAATTFLACVFIVEVDILATLLAVSAPLVIVGTATHPRWLVSRLLDVAPLRWIGRLSYSIYLFQQPFLDEHIAVEHAYLYVLPLACASYYLVERPMIRLGRDLLAGGSRSPSRGRRMLGAGVVVAMLGVIVSVLVLRDGKLVGSTVVVYADQELCGPRRRLGIGRHDLTQPGSIGNDVVSSLRVGTKARVRLCDDVHDGAPGGECRDFEPGSIVLSLDSLADRASFIEVRAAE